MHDSRSIVLLMLILQKVGCTFRTQHALLTVAIRCTVDVNPASSSPWNALLTHTLLSFSHPLHVWISTSWDSMSDGTGHAGPGSAGPGSTHSSHRPAAR
ncbi:hypothetical protein V8C86DRAFT_1075001 [Haematococcus lacustris]